MVTTFAIQNLTDSTLVHDFVTADCGQGTIDILWSCLAAIFLSIWTVIHPPIPCFDRDRPDNFRRKVVRSRIGPSLVALFAPEYMLYVALHENAESRVASKRLRELSIVANLTHGFFLNMGGFCLRSSPGHSHQLRRDDVIRAITASKTAAGIKDATTISNIADRINDATSASDTAVGIKDATTAPDTAVEIKDALLHSEEWVRKLLSIEENDIEDLAKSDSLEKVLACFQGLWVLTQAISRIYQHRALSLLEVTTNAYICCAIGSYALWWKKPQNCSRPIMVTCSDEAIDELSPSIYGFMEDRWVEFLWAGRPPSEGRKFEGATTISIYNGLRGISILSLMIFGSVHLASWNSRLPSTIELWMWRGSSLYCVIFAAVFAFISALRVIVMRRRMRWRMKRTLQMAMGKIFIYGLRFYIIIRIYMIVEVLISLRALPASAFQSIQWSSFLPHV